MVCTAVLGLVGCDSDDPTGPGGSTLSDLAGSWTATQFVYSQAGVGTALPTVDLVDEGYTVTLSIQSSGRFTLTTVDPEGGTESDMGTLGFDPEAEDFLLIVFDDDPEDELEFLFVVVNDDSFRLVDNTGEAEFDLDDDGDLDPARINSTWVR